MALDAELGELRGALLSGERPQIAHRLDALMNEASARPPAEVVLLYAQYLLAADRPFSARLAVAALLRRRETSGRARLIDAQAAAECGESEPAQALLGASASLDDAEGPVEAELLTHLRPMETNKERRHVLTELLERAERLSGGAKRDVFRRSGLRAMDRRLSAAAGRPHHDPRDRAGAAFYIGELCVRHLDGEWVWGARAPESAVRLPTAGRSIRLHPMVWAAWKLAHPDHQIGRLIGALATITGRRSQRVIDLLETLEPTETAVEGEGELGGARHPLTAALDQALEMSERGGLILELGVWVDCPFARVVAPLVTDEREGPTLMLSVPPMDRMAAFMRYLDMLCLGPVAALPWRFTGDGDLAHGELELYARPDKGVRAALVARRLCGADVASNARWATVIAQVLLDVTLDGSLDSIDEVDQLVTGVLREGGRDRWGLLFEDRTAILFMLTCYIGEVLRSVHGGSWGADRLTGEPVGPTSGLEIGDLRFNLGAQLLKRFYEPSAEPLAESVKRFRRRVSERGPHMSDQD